MNTTMIVSLQCPKLSSNTFPCRSSIAASLKEVFFIYSARFRIQFVADGYFRRDYGSKVNEKITGVFNHLRTYYAHSSLQVKFDLVMLPIKQINNFIRISAQNREWVTIGYLSTIPA